MSRVKQLHPFLVPVLLTLIQVLFGIGYVVSKVLVDAFPPLLWASVRLIIAAAVMVGIALAMKRPHPKRGRKFFSALSLMSFALMGIVINQAAFLLGLHYTTPANSAILNTLTPVFTLMIVTLRGQEKFDLRKGFGFFCAFSGVLVLRKIENFSFSDKPAIGDMLVLLNCVSFSFFITFSKSFVEKYDPFWTTAWLFVYGAIGMTILAIPDWIRFQWPVMTPLLWGCAFYGIVCGTLLTYYLNNWTLKHTHSSQVALFVYLQPVITMVIAYFWLGEKVTLRTSLSCMVIFIGLLVAISRRPKTTVLQKANEF